MNFILYVIPLIIAGIVYRVFCKAVDVKSTSNTPLAVLLFAVVAAEWLILEIQGEETSLPGVFTWVIAARLVYSMFSVSPDPEAMKPELHMQDGKVVLFLPHVKIDSDNRTGKKYDCEYVFDEASITRNYGILTIEGSGIKTILEHSDASEPGIPAGRESFQNQTFKYNIDEILIYCDETDKLNAAAVCEG